LDLSSKENHRYEKKFLKRMAHKSVALQVCLSPVPGFACRVLDRSPSSLVKLPEARERKFPVLEPLTILLDHFNPNEWIKVKRCKHVRKCRSVLLRPATADVAHWTWRSLVSHRRSTKSGSFHSDYFQNLNRPLRHEVSRSPDVSLGRLYPYYESKEKKRPMHLNLGIPQAVPRALQTALPLTSVGVLCPRSQSMAGRIPP
jgi:hypothetical protein